MKKLVGILALSVLIFSAFGIFALAYVEDVHYDSSISFLDEVTVGEASYNHTLVQLKYYNAHCDYWLGWFEIELQHFKPTFLWFGDWETEKWWNSDMNRTDVYKLCTDVVEDSKKYRYILHARQNIEDRGFTQSALIYDIDIERVIALSLTY